MTTTLSQSIQPQVRTIDGLSIPAGMREDFVNVQRPAHDCPHIFLPAKPFADCILEDLDIDPARARQECVRAL